MAIRLRRGDIVEAQDEEGVFTAVVAHTELLVLSNVVVCLITHDPIDIALPVRVSLLAPLPGIKLAAQVLADKLGMAPRLVVYPLI